MVLVVDDPDLVFTHGVADRPSHAKVCNRAMMMLRLTISTRKSLSDLDRSIHHFRISKGG